MILKRQDAFTLIELLAVIIILGIILVLAVPRVSNLIDKYRDKAYDIQIDNMVTIAKEYSLLHSSKIEWNDDIAYIKIQDLQTYDLLPDPLKNPKGGTFDSDEIVLSLIKDENGLIKYHKGEFIPPSTLASIIEDDISTHEKHEGTNKAFFYVGANPDNWIEFGEIDETPVLWRIIKCNEEGIKIIYEGLRKPYNAPPAHDGRMNGNIYVWDSTGDIHGSNDWERPADLKKDLNDWYTTTLTISNSNHVAPIKWCIGAIHWFDPTLLATFLSAECESTTSDFTGVGLIRASDYISTSGDAGCIASGKTDCMYDNFLFKTYTSYTYWTQIATTSVSYGVWTVSSTGSLSLYSASSELGVRPPSLI